MKTFDTLYYRDEIKMSREEWLEKLQKDIAVVQHKNPSCPILKAVMYDIGRGLTSVVNQHVYKQVVIKSVNVVL